MIIFMKKYKIIEADLAHYKNEFNRINGVLNQRIREIAEYRKEIKRLLIQRNDMIDEISQLQGDNKRLLQEKANLAQCVFEAAKSEGEVDNNGIMLNIPEEELDGED